MTNSTLVDLRHRLEREHVSLMTQFRMHQECLVMRESKRALEILICFEGLLLGHMEVEERYLLPLCEISTDRSGHWGPHVYTQEHKRIREMLASLRMRMAMHSVKSDGGMTASDIIDLLDEEKVLKHLISHHQTREATALYPAILGGTAV